MEKICNDIKMNVIVMDFVLVDTDRGNYNDHNYNNDDNVVYSCKTAQNDFYIVYCEEKLEVTFSVRLCLKSMKIFYVI